MRYVNNFFFVPSHAVARGLRTEIDAQTEGHRPVAMRVASPVCRAAAAGIRSRTWSGLLVELSTRGTRDGAAVASGERLAAHHRPRPAAAGPGDAPGGGCGAPAPEHAPSRRLLASRQRQVAGSVIDSFWIDRIPYAARHGSDQLFVADQEVVGLWHAHTGRARELGCLGFGCRWTGLEPPRTARGCPAHREAAVELGGRRSGSSSVRCRRPHVRGPAPDAR